MDLHSRLFSGQRRKLINLRFHPGLQLQLPALLIVTTIGFFGLFLAHTSEAFGALIEISLEDLWLRALVEEVQHDYLVVSLSIAIGYAVMVAGICLAGTHHLLGPVVALRRHLESVKKGNYTSRIHLRAGHPLCGIAQDLNELSEMLNRSTVSESTAYAAPGNTRLDDRAAASVDRLLTIFGSEDASEEILERRLASVAG